MSVTGVLVFGGLTCPPTLRVSNGCRRGDGGTAASAGRATAVIGSAVWSRNIRRKALNCMKSSRWVTTAKTTKMMKNLKSARTLTSLFS